ncbi:LCP family protein [Streptomyces neyagawaensis]|uniref:LCP family protein n=1 Tax=Streptomyces neyagawaensis TaxID=42238 RepID=UPI0007C76C3C|nr:LCP family protein [Streptomyces neyagawaensis]MCL6738323.1 LCP family protein [Streptomyces neyagawaensis]MDE1688168.1 LCP family protein [Streptomyces neyagawaensis]
MLVFALVTVLALLGLGIGGVWWATNHYGDQVTRIPHAFPDSSRPPKAEGAKGTTFLLAGVDSRSREPTTGRDATTRLWKYGAQRSDTLMLVHLGPGERTASTVSIPRDSWVPIPGHGSAKINAAFSWGGPPLLIQTVEQLTGTRVDHFGVIDWYGFRSLTDAVGGVPVTVPEDSYDTEQHRHFTAGTHTMDGEEALAYVRQRHGLPGGELDRIKRQQQFLRSLVGEVRGEVGVTDPLGTARMLDAITRTVSVDDGMSNGELRDLALGLRHLNTSDTSFATAPIVRSEMIRGQYALILDREKLRALCRAVETEHPPRTGK